MTDAHELLAEVAASARYGPATVALLAEATLPDHGDDLDDDAAMAVVHAIDVTAQAGMTDVDLVELVSALRRRHGAGWREPFWRGQLHAAAIRAADPDRYGTSPTRHALDQTGLAERGPQVASTNGTEVTRTMSTTNGDGDRAERLAAQISVPVHLPQRLDGSRIDRLSATSLAMFLKCPEQWRRHHLCRERVPATPAMALGSIVDAVAGHLLSAVIAGRQPPAGRSLMELLDHERTAHLERNEIVWTDDEPQQMVEQIGRDAVALFADEIVPTITDPIAVQRRFRFKLAPQAAWEVVGAIDIEETHRVRDTKVKSKSLYGHDVERDVQASTYLLVRWLERRAAEVFIWDVILKPGKQRRSIGWTQVPTRRSIGQLRSTLVRYAAAARRMVALFEAFGPDQPWDFADPRHTLCSARYCGFYSSCPGGGGLADAMPQVVEEALAQPVAIREIPSLRRADDDPPLPAPPDPHGVLRDEVPA